MKKIILSLFVSVLTFGAFAQFQVSVSLYGNCIQSDQNTYYVVYVEVRDTYNNNALVEGKTLVTPTTNYTSYPVNLIVQLSAFCTQDALERYKVYIDAKKAYLPPLTVICSQKKTLTGLFSCDRFSQTTPVPGGDLTLQ